MSSSKLFALGKYICVYKNIWTYINYFIIYILITTPPLRIPYQRAQHFSAGLATQIAKFVALFVSWLQMSRNRTDFAQFLELSRWPSGPFARFGGYLPALPGYLADIYAALPGLYSRKNWKNSFEAANKVFLPPAVFLTNHHATPSGAVVFVKRLSIFTFLLVQASL